MPGGEAVSPSVPQPHLLWPHVGPGLGAGPRRASRPEVEKTDLDLLYDTLGLEDPRRQAAPTWRMAAGVSAPWLEAENFL